ncbi:hypothetical protein PLICRDRAFT_174846 [Plicaturopsis crispa FD-325 SS-3]|nr:hypothetical protein PLICRDRAFT_174846 [Plicaturopsis crispa FD-325 SS-3]
MHALARQVSPRAKRSVGLCRRLMRPPPTSELLVTRAPVHVRAGHLTSASRSMGSTSTAAGGAAAFANAAFGTSICGSRGFRVARI